MAFTKNAIFSENTAIHLYLFFINTPFKWIHFWFWHLESFYCSIMVFSVNKTIFTRITNKCTKMYAQTKPKHFGGWLKMWKACQFVRNLFSIERLNKSHNICKWIVSFEWLLYFSLNHPIGSTNRMIRSTNRPIWLTNRPIRSTNHPIRSTNHPMWSEILKRSDYFVKRYVIFLTPLPYKPINYIRFCHWPIEFFLLILVQNFVQSVSSIILRN